MKCIPHQEPDPKNKTSHSHYNFLSKLIEIYWRWLSMIGSYSVQSSVTRLIRGPHVKSRTLKIKPRVHTIKFLSKLTEIYWKWLSMIDSYSVQSSVARPTRGPHVKIRTLELKHRVHTIKFYRNWSKFVGDDSVWLAAILCKTVCQYLYYNFFEKQVLIRL